MENLILLVAVLATANTQVTRLAESWLESFLHVSFNKIGNQILSWVVAYVLALLSSAVGVIDANWFGVILYGLISGLASNGIWNIKNWWATL